ncbi:unnamed protein product [Lampetra planeri]
MGGSPSTIGGVSMHVQGCAFAIGGVSMHVQGCAFAIGGVSMHVQGCAFTIGILLEVQSEQTAQRSSDQQPVFNEVAQAVR